MAPNDIIELIPSLAWLSDHRIRSVLRVQSRRLPACWTERDRHIVPATEATNYSRATTAIDGCQGYGDGSVGCRSGSGSKERER